jgi:hypothetical protein
MRLMLLLLLLIKLLLLLLLLINLQINRNIRCIWELLLSVVVVALAQVCAWKTLGRCLLRSWGLVIELLSRGLLILQLLLLIGRSCYQVLLWALDIHWILFVKLVVISIAAFLVLRHWGNSLFTVLHLRLLLLLLFLTSDIFRFFLLFLLLILLLLGLVITRCLLLI